MRRFVAVAALTTSLFGGAAQVRAQTTLDRVDPAKIEQTLPADGRRVSALPPTAAPAPVTAAPAPGGTPITVGAIALAGLTVLRPADFADVFETYVGRTLSPPALAGLADAIADRARSRGFLFASAQIPPQTIEAGMVRVVVDEGRVDEVRVVGTDNSAVRAALAPLAGSGPVTNDMLQRRLLLAGDIDGLWLKRTRLVREGTRNILLVEVGTKRVSGLAGLDNNGTRTVGPLRLDVTARVSQLIAADDAVFVTVAANPIMPRELAYGRVRYAKRISADGTEASASFSYATVKPGSYLADYDIVGRSWMAQIETTRPLLRRRTASWWLQASFDVRSVKQDYMGEQVRRDRLSSARLTISGYTTILGGVLRANGTLSEGVGLFGITRADDPLASRPDADGHYTSLDASLDWTGTLSGPVSLDITAAGQVADRPLLLSEQLGLGGGAYLRPYDYDERSGDEGVVASAELRYAVADKLGPLRKPLVYSFVGGGYVTNLRTMPGGGSLFATGAGVRSAIGASLSADAGVVVPLSGPRYDTGTDDPVFSFRLARRF